jgi:DNA-binding CsgD family transcriptional regulator
MSVRRRRIDGLIDDVALLGRRGLPREQYFGEVAARLRRVIDCDATCWHTLDPQTRLMTSEAPQELIDAGMFTLQTAPQAGAAMVASEYFVADVNTFAGLASRRIPVGILSRVTAGGPERSTRYRELLAPAGIPFELRAAFVTRGRCWGAVHIARLEHNRDFTAEEADVLARLSATIADGIRTSVRFDAARQSQDRTAPGLVVLGPANEIELITAPAQELLEAMRSSALTTDTGPPTPLLALAAFTRRHHAAGADRQPDIVAVPSPSGWITLHASLPDGRADGQVAIVLERTATPQATALRLEADGVTPREREIATLIAQGRANPEIADALVLSPYTVQDHVKSLFEKTGVASRQELVARIFLDDYMPRVAQRAPLAATGSFAQT